MAGENFVTGDRVDEGKLAIQAANARIRELEQKLAAVTVEELHRRAFAAESAVKDAELRAADAESKLAELLAVVDPLLEALQGVQGRLREVLVRQISQGKRGMRGVVRSAVMRPLAAGVKLQDPDKTPIGHGAKLLRRCKALRRHLGAAHDAFGEFLGTLDSTWNQFRGDQIAAIQQLLLPVTIERRRVVKVVDKLWREAPPQ